MGYETMNSRNALSCNDITFALRSSLLGTPMGENAGPLKLETLGDKEN